LIAQVPFGEAMALTTPKSMPSTPSRTSLVQSAGRGPGRSAWTEESVRWLATELRAERQAINAALLARHETLLQTLSQEQPTLAETPKCNEPFHASSRSVFTGISASTTQLPAIQHPDAPDERINSEVNQKTGSVPGKVSLATMSVRTSSSLEASKKKVPVSPTSPTLKTKRSNSRSLVYGDRHPDQGLFHVDCSSLKNFVRGPAFETSFAILIVVNTIFMALEYQFNGLLVGLEINYPNLSTVTSRHWPWARDTFEAAEWFFGLAFSGELILKLAGLRRSFFKDCWNYLDVLIVMFWIIDVLPLDPMLIRILRLAKLLRLVKLAKSIKSFDSLYLLTASIASSASALVWSGVLICIVQLSVALVLSTFLLPYCTDLSIPMDDRYEVYRYFGTFSRSMLSMFELTLGNWVPISRILSERVSEWYTIFTLAFQVILGFAVIKVITGVFLTETMKVASMDDSIMLKSKERAVRLHKEKMGRLFAHADLDANGGIDCLEFQTLLEDKEVRQWLASMELEIFSEQDGDALFNMIDDGDGIVTLDELVKGVARLKGQARNVDLALMNRRLLELKQELLDMQQRQFERITVSNEEIPPKCSI